MKQFASIALCLALFAATPPLAASDEGATKARWNLARAPAKAQHITRDTRKVRIEYFVATCNIGEASDYLRRVKVRRRRKSVDITVFVSQPAVEPGRPCPAVAAIGRTRVDLRGRLGKRSLRDASTSPPRVVLTRRPG